MPDPVDRFLRHRPTIPTEPGLGRLYGVAQESWPLSADPAQVRPKRVILANGRSAAEAADIARAAAAGYRSNGYHKPTAAWWGVADGQFHRFLVTARPRRRTSLLFGIGLVSLATLAVARSRRSASNKP